MLTTRRSIVVPVAALALMGATAPAFAADGDGGSAALSATLTAGSIGSRSVTTVAPVALTTALSSSTATGAVSVVVTEAARGGTNPWSVTAVAGALTSGVNTIAASNLSIASRGVTQVAGGGTAAAPTGSSSLASAATLFSTTGQSVASLYTGTYTAAGTVSLAVPNGQAVGAYTGTFTVTLVQ